MPLALRSLVYLMFFLSGAAGLIYEVVWFRSLSLIFGGAHLAVATVLSVFMTGLALGSYFIGRNLSDARKLLKWYGLLELAIALSAGLFILLIKFYPSLYLPLARLYPDSPFYLSLVRVVLSAVAMVVPATLMGGTLPVLSALISQKGRALGDDLSFLYGINTLGAVAGTVGAGFFLLRYFTVNLTFFIPMFINILIGVIAVMLQNKIPTGPVSGRETEPDMRGRKEFTENEIRQYRFPLRLVLWGIGVSGFCALGYEVLWTRLLAFILGPSIYGYTIMLAAFLSGIGLGSSTFTVFRRLARAAFRGNSSVPAGIFGFGLVQIVIGLSAIFVTAHFFDVPAFAAAIQHFFKSSGGSVAFGTVQWANFVVAFVYLFIPALFMGLAFPLAGEIYSGYRKTAGRTVGEITAFNTVGAILGAAVSGYAMIYLMGIERSLQILSMVNIGYGIFLITAMKNNRIANATAAAGAAAVALFLSLNPGGFKSLNPAFFSIYKINNQDQFTSRARLDLALRNTKVLYHGEGAESIVTSFLDSEGFQSFSTNGLNEASNRFEDMQCQYTLGHLPMLLNRDPKRVLVIGLGSGMTAGATSVHPEVEQITLVEIEPKVLGVAESFSFYNHSILRNPKLKIIFNDGRNHLLTTTERYDVITADPIHPYFRGAGYLYTDEYFRLASGRLAPGGIMCQWLPMYRLTPENVASIVKTFSQNFKYTMMWKTVYDTALVGSNSPIVIDEKELKRRMQNRSVSFDLQWVMMGTPDSFLSYFLMGDRGVRAVSERGILNTDDNLYLEFSAPFSFNKSSLKQENIELLLGYRENIIDYLEVPADAALRNRQKKKWNEFQSVVPLVNEVHALMLKGRMSSPEFRNLMKQLEKQAPTFARGYR